MFCGLLQLPDREVAFKSIIRRKFTVKEAQAAKEVFVAGTTIPVTSITFWDKKKIADGTTGIHTLAFNALVMNDAEPTPTTIVHSEVPYGYLTGKIESQLFTV